MADVFRQEGKIFVLVVIILVILGGIFLYLFSMERRIKKLEKERKGTETDS